MNFKIGYDKRDSELLHRYWDDIITSQKWSEGKYVSFFEEKWSLFNELSSVAFSSWAGAALSVMDFIRVKGQTVLCPSNTFMATPLSIIKSGGNVAFVDCNKDDLCINVDDLKKKIEIYNPVAVWVVHIGGHIAFQIDEIAQLCQQKRIYLIEDCAHAHGASWNGKKPGAWGDAGIYSFYATKTISTGEGGMLVSKNNELVEFAKKYRNYGKPDYAIHGLNYRMSEFTAALGCVEVDRLPDIIEWKNEYAQKKLNPQYHKRVLFPEGMISGYYKYIVFENILNSTGKVYEQPCHRIIGHDVSLPNTEWIANNHWCVPLYYYGDESGGEI